MFTRFATLALAWIVSTMALAQVLINPSYSMAVCRNIDALPLWYDHTGPPSVAYLPKSCTTEIGLEIISTSQETEALMHNGDMLEIETLSVKLTKDAEPSIFYRIRNVIVATEA